MKLAHRLGRRIGDRGWAVFLARKLAPLDRRAQQWTKGRRSILGVFGPPPLLLTTIGHRTGRQRSVPLTYVPAPNGYYVTGSNWGRSVHPAWTDNLLAHPQATVAVGGETHPVHAHALDADECASVWPAFVRLWPAYSRYATQSGRELRVFRLETADGGERG